MTKFFTQKPFLCLGGELWCSTCSCNFDPRLPSLCLTLTTPNLAFKTDIFSKVHLQIQDIHKQTGMSSKNGHSISGEHTKTTQIPKHCNAFDGNSSKMEVAQKRSGTHWAGARDTLGKPSGTSWFLIHLVVQRASGTLSSTHFGHHFGTPRILFADQSRVLTTMHSVERCRPIVQTCKRALCDKS